MHFLFKNSKTTLSSQFGLLTGLLIAITVFSIAFYSTTFVSTMTKEVTEKTKSFNNSVEETVMQVISDYIEKGDYDAIKPTARKMVENNLIAGFSIINMKTGKEVFSEIKKIDTRLGVKTKKNKELLSKNEKKQEADIYPKEETIGNIKIIIWFYSEPIVKQGLDILTENMTAMVIISIFFGFFLSNFLAKVLIKPIDMLVRSLVDSKGDFSLRLEETNYLEINRIITAYNDTADSLEKMYQSVEQQVQDRTQELAQANSELKSTQAMMVHSEKMKSLGELVAGITHEINNPINFIYGNLIHLNNYTKDLMNVIETYSEFNDDLTEEHKETIAKIKEEMDFDFIKNDLPDLIRSCQEGTERTKNIVFDLKNFSRLEEAVINNVDLPKEIDTTLNILHNKLKHKITLHKEYTENIPTIEGYGGQLNQVFMNILDNAAHAIKEKGDIWIRIKPESNHIILEFEDNGCGMDKDIAEKVFDPFFTTKPVGQGTGLGMAISYKVIKNHKGDIKIESEKDKGTKFIITLPLKMEK